MYSLNQIKDRLEYLKYKFFTNGDYNVNIIGVRKLPLNTNTFNDELYLIFKKGNQWVRNVYSITTDPGFLSLTKPENSKGTAILVPGQYSGCYAVGIHKTYESLVQVGPVKVYRDNDKDKLLDIDKSKIDEGLFGINIHKAGVSSTIVDNWSAGCQVFKNSEDFDEFMKIINISKKLYGNKFTYTLLDEF